MLLHLSKVANIIFLEHRLSLFCKTSCIHPLLKGYYIYFWRSLTGIHCVWTMHLTDSFVSDVLLFSFFFFVKGTLNLFYNSNCSQLSNQVTCDCFKSTEKIMYSLKETNCSSDFSIVPVYSAKLSAVCVVSSVQCSMHKKYL